MNVASDLCPVARRHGNGPGQTRRVVLHDVAADLLRSHLVRKAYLGET